MFNLRNQPVLTFDTTVWEFNFSEVRRIDWREVEIMNISNEYGWLFTTISFRKTMALFHGWSFGRCGQANVCGCQVHSRFLLFSRSGFDKIVGLLM